MKPGGRPPGDAKGKRAAANWPRVRRVVLLLVVALLLAGCSRPATPDPPLPAFDGTAAHAFVAGLVTHDNGTARFRVPGTAAHGEAAAWLAGALQTAGWSVQWQNFTGADYVGAETGSAGFYRDPKNGYCSSEEESRLAGLAFHNLVATHTAEPDTSRTLYLGAHWESKRFASSDPDAARRSEPVLGANDGASGVGVLLALQRYLAANDVQLPFNVVVVLFDGEDGFEDCHPLAGSTHFVNQLPPGPDSLLSPRRMLLLDMVGDPAARFIRERQSERCDPTLVGLLHELAPAVGLAANFPNVTRTVSDDHVPFLEAGIPAVDLIDFGRGFPPYWHTTQDTLDKVDAAMLGRVGDLLVATLTDDRFVDDWPARC